MSILTYLKRRVVALPSKEGDFLDIDSLSEGFEVGYQDLVAERPITCAKTGVQHAAISHPTTVVLDVSNPPIECINFQLIRILIGCRFSRTEH